MRRGSIFATTMIAFLMMAGTVLAADATGKWTWSTEGQDGTPRVTTMTLKAEGEALTGSVLAPGRGGAEPTPVEIKEGKIAADGTFTFKTVRVFNEQERVTNYSGKVDGDNIVGKISRTTGQGELQETEWKATRVKEGAPATPAAPAAPAAPAQ